MLFSKNQRIGSDVDTTPFSEGQKKEKKKLEVMVV
jgi:hypothetical protein